MAPQRKRNMTTSAANPANAVEITAPSSDASNLPDPEIFTMGGLVEFCGTGAEAAGVYGFGTGYCLGVGTGMGMLLMCEEAA